MLRVGLTGELGSGKSTVAHLLAQHGAIVFSSDEMGRALMQPGTPVYLAIVERFGPGVLLPDGTLNRPELARLAFHPEHPRVEELNAIVHPAVLAQQEHRIAAMAQTNPDAIIVVESALIFTTKHAGGEEPWRRRFDRIVVVTAPDSFKVERFLQRTLGPSAGEEEKLQARHDAAARIAAQRLAMPADEDILYLRNDGSMVELGEQVNRLWSTLIAASLSFRNS